MGKTSYMDNIVIQELGEAVITKDTMEEYANNKNLQSRLTLKKIDKVVRA